MSTTGSRSKDVTALALGFAASGVVHLVRPQTYLPLMPDYVPAPREVILGSGVIELVCAAGMLSRRFRRPAGWASAAVLVGVFPAHIKMAQDAARSGDARFRAVAYGRMPLQLPMLRIALKAARS